MLVFAKDINLKNHIHALEDSNSELKSYMEYQRKLFPYTIFRGGLDLAYKELDDILNYVDNGYKAPEDSARKEFPEDVDDWFKGQYPWSSSFLNKDSVHSVLVVLIKGMESYRTYEFLNAYHWMVLYDVVHSAISFYNELLTFSPERATDIKLSQKIPIQFSDFINNYWHQLDFMVMSKPDYLHERLLAKNRPIEEALRGLMNEGNNPADALEKVAEKFSLEPATLSCLRHERVTERLLELRSVPMKEDPYNLSKDICGENGDLMGLSNLDADFFLNYQLMNAQKDL
jgi:hypothetical protein